jgi:transcription antitermination factor NusG
MDLKQTGISSMQFIPGAGGLVTFEGEAADVPDGLIHAIQAKTDQINEDGGELFEVLNTGETVVIHSGPLAGYEAIFNARLPGSQRVRVLLKLLKNRQMPVDLPAYQVRLKNRPA